MDFKESTDQQIVDRLDLRPNDKLYLGDYGNDVYTVERKLGKGGFGSVFSVRDKHQIKAIKILHLWEILKNEHKQLKDRFEIEYDIGKINSEYLVSTYSKGYIGGNPYITMEYCPNGNLYEKQNQYTKESDYETIAFRLLSGLEDLHAHDVIHRDIKPENLIFDSSNNLKITDFGISAYLNRRKTERGIFGNAKQAFGSVLYSPPEQMITSKAYKYTRATMDVYAVGVTLYFLLSDGFFPFGSFEDYKNDAEAYITRKNQKRYSLLSEIKPRLHGKWSFAINKCLDPDPDSRIQSIRELKEMLDLKVQRVKGETTEWFKNNTLKVTGGEQRGDIIDLDELRHKNSKLLLRLGRHGNGNSNDIALLERYTSYVSTCHATLEFNNEEWYMRDGQFLNDKDGPRWKNSTNGTMINDAIVSKLESHKLTHGDTIRIGEFVLKYYRAMER